MREREAKKDSEMDRERVQRGTEESELNMHMIQGAGNNYITSSRIEHLSSQIEFRNLEYNIIYGFL